MSQVVNHRPASYWYRLCRTYGIHEDARQEASVVILTHSARCLTRPRPLYYLAGLVANALQRLVRTHCLLVPVDHEILEFLPDPRAGSPASDEDPFDLVPTADRELLRDYFYLGSVRKLAEQLGAKKTATHKRVTSALSRLRATHVA